MMSLLNDVIPSWLKWTAIAVFLVALLVAGAYGGYKYRDTTAQQQINKIDADNIKANQVYEDQIKNLIIVQHAISQQLQDQLAKQAVVVAPITKTVIKEVTKPVYLQCVVPDTGVLIWNDQATKLNALREAQK